MIGGTTRIILGALAIGGVAMTAPPALAQDGSEARIRKLESEVRALQRRVFPGGDGRFFEPEITGAASSSGNTAAPSTTAVTDILARLDALEAQIARLTARSEEQENAMGILVTRITALENASPATTLASNSGSSAATTTSVSATDTSDDTPAVSGPSADRLAAVQAIAKPQTDDAADDEYSYGYRLWNAGFYPEAQQQLSMFVEQNPSHWRTTYGRNLLGRAFLDDGKPREAAPWFLQNYQADKQAARAPDSLLFLAEAMIVLEDTNRACIALAEFGETYPALATGRLSGQYQRNLGRVDCD